jgi:60 kDa SS-A/Ro ribonucleoprotein
MADFADPWLLHASIGNNPSYRDILRSSHFKPRTNFERAVNGSLGDFDTKYWNPASPADLPMLLKALNAYNKSETEDAQLLIMPWLTEVRWDLLGSKAKGPKVWRAICRNMSPTALRMNINTMHRHGVFTDPETTGHIAARLRDPDDIKRGRSFPYSYFMAYMSLDVCVPSEIKEALATAMELSCGNVPRLPLPIVIGMDQSQSMSSPVTGRRSSHTSKATCSMVSALFAASLWRANPDSIIVPFNDSVIGHNMRPTTPLVELASAFTHMCSGGTDCSVPLKHVMAAYPGKQFGGMVIVSDNESWVDAGCMNLTSTVLGWDKFKRQQAALGNTAELKYVGIDIQPSGTCQNKEGQGVMNVGGFTDGVFDIVAAFFLDDCQRFISAVDDTYINTHLRYGK